MCTHATRVLGYTNTHTHAGCNYHVFRAREITCVPYCFCALVSLSLRARARGEFVSHDIVYSFVFFCCCCSFAALSGMSLFFVGAASERVHENAHCTRIFVAYACNLMSCFGVPARAHHLSAFYVCYGTKCITLARRRQARACVCNYSHTLCTSAAASAAVSQGEMCFLLFVCALHARRESCAMHTHTNFG